MTSGPPFLLLIFSPLETADFFMLLRLLGDGYSLLCSKKQPSLHTSAVLSHRGRIYPHQRNDMWDGGRGVALPVIYYVGIIVSLGPIVFLLEFIYSKWDGHWGR